MTLQFLINLFGAPENVLPGRTAADVAPSYLESQNQ